MRPIADTTLATRSVQKACKLRSGITEETPVEIRPKAALTVSEREADKEPPEAAEKTFTPRFNASGNKMGETSASAIFISGSEADSFQ